MKESDMYLYLKKYFEEKGYTVYPEIQLNTGRPRADIVALKDEDILIVEMKTRFGLAVMEQADHWASGGYAHHTYIAVPWRDKWQVPTIAQRALEMVGVGVIQVNTNTNPHTLENPADMLLSLTNLDKLDNDRTRKRRAQAYHSYEARRINTCIEAKYRSEAINTDRILSVLTPYHLNGPTAGAKAGGHISAHRLTMIRAKEYLAAADEWVTPIQICENIETHYFAKNKAASLKQALLAFGTDFCEYQVFKGRGYFRIKSE